MQIGARHLIPGGNSGWWSKAGGAEWNECEWMLYSRLLSESAIVRTSEHVDTWAYLELQGEPSAQSDPAVARAITELVRRCRQQRIRTITTLADKKVVTELNVERPYSTR
jgi:CRP-like cAMP-binding protein